MYQERQRGLICSALAHLLLLVLMIFGLPTWLIPPPPPEPVAISVELLPISTISNIKPSEKPPSPEPEKKEPTPPPPPKPPTPPVKTTEPTPPPPPKEDPLKVKKDEKKPDVKKEEPKKEEPKKEKAKEEDLDAILKAVKKSAQQQKPDEQKKPDKKEPVKDASSASKSISSQYDASLPMSMSEKDAIRSQFAKCWSVPAGAKDAHNLVVVLDITAEMDGTVTQVQLNSASKSRYASDQFFRAAADSAMRAVHQCSPLKNLPADKFGTWKQMELTFDPKEMLF